MPPREISLTSSSAEASELAGDRLTKLVPAIQRTAGLVQDITAASREQSSGADQINYAIQQLNRVVQQNAGAAEEMATTATSLVEQANQLEALIAFFKVANGDGLEAEKQAALPERTVDDQVKV
jgi:methyl-accepting chemotaxis protein